MNPRSRSRDGGHPPARSPSTPRWRRAAAICGVLALVTVAVYLPVRHHEFGIDVADYIADNPHVRDGLTADNVAWALVGVHANNWHPLTWVSHMLDVELYGLDPAGHHLTNVVLHALNAVLLFLVLARATGRTWPPAFVAALFALHPLHVESVAWALERKDVLSTLFGLLTLAAWLRYAARPAPARYALALLAFVLGLAAKPMLVTLPVVLLLLDLWPLRRWVPTAADPGAGRSTGTWPTLLPPLPLLLEKIPLLVLGAVVSAITLVAQGDAVATLERFPLLLRLENALVSYVVYPLQALWPAGLAFYYPHPRAVPAWQVGGAALLLAAATYGALRAARRFPWLTVGWFWYVVTLLPVIGVVQVGAQARADRYTYLPLIGLFVIAAWGGAGWLGRRRSHRRALVAAATAASVLVVAACAVATRLQLRHWETPESLLLRSTAVTRDNFFAHYNLANRLKRAGRVEQAIAHYRESVRIEPDSLIATYNLGNALVQQGDLEAALDAYDEALRIQPGNPDVLYAIGNAEMGAGLLDDAIAHYRAALDSGGGTPDPEVLNNLGIALFRQGRPEQAVATFEQALAILPDARRHNSLGVVLMRLGRPDDAVAHFREALRIDPGHAPSRANLEVALAAAPAGSASGGALAGGGSGSTPPRR